MKLLVLVKNYLINTNKKTIKKQMKETQFHMKIQLHQSKVQVKKVKKKTKMIK